jgi:hypothetical protein
VPSRAIVKVGCAVGKRSLRHNNGAEDHEGHRHRRQKLESRTATQLLSYLNRVKPLDTGEIKRLQRETEGSPIYSGEVRNA